MGSSEPRSGTFANGMEYLTCGDGLKAMLFIPGGPGSQLPTGAMRRMYCRRFEAYHEAGYSVWFVTRRRHMPQGYTLAEMADDYAEVIRSELGGWVELVVGESMGGMVAQHLAASHADLFGRLALVITGCEESAWGKQLDARLAEAIPRRDAAGVGEVFVEYFVPGGRERWVRRLLGRPLGRRLLRGSGLPPGDLLVEARAEEAFDSRAVLPSIAKPVLMLCGDRDRFFPRSVVEETAALIPDCRVVWYAGKGHVRAAMDRRVPRDVLAFVEQDRAATTGG
ncbi:MAG: alpha/beta fold hydrolase [Nocardioides sp.]